MMWLSDRIKLREQLVSEGLTALSLEDSSPPAEDYPQHTHNRFHTLDFIAEYLAKDGIAGDIVECGSYKGGTGIYLAKLFPDRRIWLLDSFRGIDKIEDRTYKYALTAHRGGEHVASFLECLNSLKKYKVDNNVVVLPGWFKNTLKYVEAEKIALLRLDGDTYSSHRECLDALYDKVVPGGAIVVDDSSIDEVRKGIHDWAQQLQIVPKFRDAYGSCNPIFPFYFDSNKHWGIWWKKGEV